MDRDEVALKVWEDEGGALGEVDLPTVKPDKALFRNHKNISKVAGSHNIEGEITAVTEGGKQVIRLEQ